jgi:uncharacterized membrane protein
MTTELNTILFLHILFALLLVGGGFAFLVLLRRAQRAQSLAAARATLVGARTIESALIVPSAVLVGLVGIALVLRYDAKGIFDAGKAVWMHIGSTLWLIMLVVGFFSGRALRRALALAEQGEGEGALERVKASIRSPGVSGLTYLNLALALVILYLMVFQPFAGEGGQALRRGVLVTKELNLILLIHILFAMALLGGVTAHLLVHARFRSEGDATVLRATMANLRGIENALIIGNGVLVGVMGLLLAWRYDAKGVLSFGDSRWLHVAIALWVAANVIGFLEGRSLERAYKLGDDSGADVARIRAVFNSPVYTALASLNVVVVLVLVYLMVFQP